MPDLHPGLVLIAGALLVAGLRGPLRTAVALLVPLAALALLTVSDGVIWTARLAGYTTVPFEVDRLSRLFATIREKLGDRAAAAYSLTFYERALVGLIYKMTAHPTACSGRA